MNITNQTQTVEANSNQERIGLAAYYLWEKGGCQSGREVEYWLRAEKQLQALSPDVQPLKVRRNLTSATPKGAPAKPINRARSKKLRRDFAAFD